MTEARKLQNQLTDAFRARDIEAILACYAPDAVVVTPEGTFRGHDELAAWVRGQFEAFPDVDVTVDATLDAGDAALDESTFSGTHSGPLALADGRTIGPTGKRVTQRSADIAVVREGRVVEHRFYYDWLEVLGQLELDSSILQTA